jgi:hypothetical protein
LLLHAHRRSYLALFATAGVGCDFWLGFEYWCWQKEGFCGQHTRDETIHADCPFGKKLLVWAVQQIFYQLHQSNFSCLFGYNET